MKPFALAPLAVSRNHARHAAIPPGSDLFLVPNRGCRFAQPPAKSFHPSGMIFWHRRPGESFVPRMQQLFFLRYLTWRYAADRNVRIQIDSFFICSRGHSKCCLCGCPVSQPFSVFECFTLNKSHVYYDLSGTAAHHKCLAVHDGITAFLEFYFVAVLDVFQHSYWSLVPVGDDFVDSTDSTFCQVDPPDYDCGRIIAALRSLGGFEQFDNDGQCRLLWESKSEAIEYTMASAGTWSGAEVEMACEPAAFLNQWRHLHRQFSQIYLHNQDCTIFAPDYFESIYVNTPLRILQSQLET